MRLWVLALMLLGSGCITSQDDEYFKLRLERLQEEYRLADAQLSAAASRARCDPNSAPVVVANAGICWPPDAGRRPAREPVVESQLKVCFEALNKGLSTAYHLSTFQGTCAVCDLPDLEKLETEVCRDHNRRLTELVAEKQASLEAWYFREERILVLEQRRERWQAHQDFMNSLNSFNNTITNINQQDAIDRNQAENERLQRELDRIQAEPPPGSY